MPSIPTVPKTCLFASVTYVFPGPHIRSTLGIVSVPKANAAIAWLPPIGKTLVTPVSLDAYRISELGIPESFGGVVI